MKYLVTGACGFIGSNFADHVLNSDDKTQVLNVDKHTSISNNFLDLKHYHDPRYSEIIMDLADPSFVSRQIDAPDVIVHFAAESHVDRSCEDVSPFISSNITATMNIMNFAIKNDVPIIYVSTDEVYGSLGLDDAPFTEQSVINPRNPYSATKASGEFLVKSLANASNFKKFAITRCSNNFGHWQDRTKLIPVCIKQLMEGKPIPIYGKGEQVRDWIHVLDHCYAIEILATKLVASGGMEDTEYNIGADNEWTNLDIAYKLCDIIGTSRDEGVEFINDPRGSAHDFRYAIDSSRMSSTGWSPEWTNPFDESLTETVEWYKRHFHWIY
jgi:dTDP-glucose 4,6-dehydratase